MEDQIRKNTQKMKQKQTNYFLLKTSWRSTLSDDVRIEAQNEIFLTKKPPDFNELTDIWEYLIVLHALFKDVKKYNYFHFINGQLSRSNYQKRNRYFGRAGKI